jgi:Zn-dependent peptidase ImmA (M78 family)
MQTEHRGSSTWGQQLKTVADPTSLGGFRSAFTLKELIDVKAAWGISITSMMMRANELNLVSKSLFYRFWAKEGKEWREAKAEPGDERYAGVEKSDRFRRLVYRGVAEGQISQLKGCELLNLSLDELRTGGRIIA